jgi:hypothetical protein
MPEQQDSGVNKKYLVIPGCERITRVTGSNRPVLWRELVVCREVAAATSEIDRRIRLIAYPSKPAGQAQSQFTQNKARRLRSTRRCLETGDECITDNDAKGWFKHFGHALH